MSAKLLIIFDKDGTLVSGPSGRPPNTIEEQVFMLRVLEVCQKLRLAGHILAVASNQGGVAWGFMPLARAQALVEDVSDKIGAAYSRLCPHDALAVKRAEHDPKYAIDCDCRKPKGGMIEDIIAEAGDAREYVLYVGDRETDEQAAKAAGVRFEWANDFFADGFEKLINPGIHQVHAQLKERVAEAEVIGQQFGGELEVEVWWRQSKVYVYGFHKINPKTIESIEAIRQVFRDKGWEVKWNDASITVSREGVL